jgi:hypothetical protein
VRFALLTLGQIPQLQTVSNYTKSPLANEQPTRDTILNVIGSWGSGFLPSVYQEFLSGLVFLQRPNRTSIAIEVWIGLAIESVGSRHNSGLETIQKKEQLRLLLLLGFSELPDKLGSQSKKNTIYDHRII